MESKIFKQFLMENSPLSEGAIERQLIAQQDNIKRIEVKKGDFLLKEGELISHSFFVEKGLLRNYSIDKKGKEHILHFATEGWFLSDRESQYFGLPTHYYIDALEYTTVMTFQKDFFSSFQEELQCIAKLNETLLHNHVRHLQKRITQLMSATAEERYLDFIKIYPDLLMRVPQWMVASYLGIAPESLSRVRKDLANKWKEK